MKLTLKLDYAPETKRAGNTAQSRMYGETQVSITFETCGVQLGNKLNYHVFYFGKTVIENIRLLINDLKNEIYKRFEKKDENKCIRICFQPKDDPLCELIYLVWLE